MRHNSGRARAGCCGNGARARELVGLTRESVSQSAPGSGAMSMVLLQLGQCGNQVGQELLELINTDGRNDLGRPDSYRAISLERFFRQEAGTDAVPVARAVLVDMEPKVISHTLAKAMKSGQWSYGNHSYFCQKQGSGNNWANGFCIHGPRHEEAVLDLVQREVEQCERFSGFIAMMSLAGGTGSGLGTYITQCLRDMYPNSFILNQLTWPYGTGEVIVQDYNAVLTLSHLYKTSDALLIHENDTVHKICSQLMNIKQISFTDINKVIAHQLGSVLQPVCTRWSISEYGTNPLGLLRLLDCPAIPSTSDWALLLTLHLLCAPSTCQIMDNFNLHRSWIKSALLLRRIISG
ncbi:tubulin delta chain-like isoform X4 [Chiloscyllium plagiosum]|uniref:tubulin delta chain-like isoform X4 n=1 Tax=Chiloscyllium plagiosum TaxID=36176 RepID=UPI001CB7F518|nr:tubulin delta chain-like isoform X4 [Chiloscyllium plagiosum]